MTEKKITLTNLLDALNEDVAFEECREKAKQDDKAAFEQAQIERITVFFYDGSQGLIIKPNDMMGVGYQINLREKGFIMLQGNEELTTKVFCIEPEDRYRVHMSTDSTVYWNDLYDERMANELAEFFGVEVTDGRDA
jgi:hypothetical protein